MDDLDTHVRVAAFGFLEEQARLGPENGALPRELLTRGFTYQGERVPLMGPQGIFKPKILREMPLSITTVPVVEGESRPYDDAFGPDGLLRYRYRGTNPQHHENVGLRLAMQRQVPLIYFHGVVPGWYVPEWPVHVVGDDPANLAFSVSVDERRFASLGAVPPDPEETEIRRRYATRVFRPASTPARVPRAGRPRLRPDVLGERDGPMLIHGLQGFHGVRLRVPKRASSRPDRRLLEQRYASFRKLAG